MNEAKRPARILIVDNESWNSKLLERMLQPEGYLTRIAANGEQAMASIAEHAPDLILLDIMMPGMDGYEVASTLKANPVTASIPIIMVTGQIDHSARVAGLNAGAEDFLSKPVDQAELCLRVRNLLRLKTLADLLKNHNQILESQVQERVAALHMFRNVMDVTADGIFLVNRSTMRFVEINTTACSMVGYTREELFQMGPAQLTLVSTEELANAYDAIITGDSANEIVVTEFFRKDGSKFPAEVYRSAKRSGADWIIVGVVRDIAERRRAEVAVAEASRAKSEFMANVTHELRTPLNSVIGFAELLKDEVPGPLNAKQAAFAADILAAGQHLLKLVGGILEMSRLDATGAAIEREPVEIGAALAERVAAQREAAGARRVSISLEVAADIGSAELDPKAFGRMLDVLLDNAIKFNRDGGTVAVSARRAGGALEIAVADTGVGIAHEDLAKLFKPLTQLDAGLAREHSGVGVGLALARRLAELHGGAIEVESEYGKGSTFTLRLPLWEKKQ